MRRTFAATFVLLMISLCGGPVGTRFEVARAGAQESPSVLQWSRFEASYTPDVAPVNPFDPDEIDVRAEFVGPGGRAIEVLAFWYQAYQRSLVNDRERLTASGAPHFLVRFTPTQKGRWRWRWVVRTPEGTTRSPFQDLRVEPAKSRGFLRISKRDRRYLAFDDGSPYLAVGENTGWYDARGTYAFDDWFGKLEEQGANFGRVWMSSWAFGIEWNDTGLGDYTARLARAWRLDHVLEQAERDGIYVMIALLNHGAFSTAFNSEWAANPYNAVNGGPLATPGAFFTDAQARKLFERRLRYVVARWGWSTHVHSWELWNEVDLTDGYNSPAVTEWHVHMANELRSLDPYDHLVTSSQAFFGSDPNVWRRGGLDFNQLHFYANVFLPFANLARTITMLTTNRLAVQTAPVLFGEIGVDTRGPVETRAADPEGIGVHDGLWAGVMSGGSGTAMTWWWDNLIAVEPERYYPMFGSVARFVEGIRWDREKFRPAQVTVTSPGRTVVPYGLRGRGKLLLWLKDDAFQWNTPQAVEIANATLSFDRRWCGQWYDPWTGEWLDTVKLTGPVAVPPFSRDIALLAAPCSAKPLHP